MQSIDTYLPSFQRFHILFHEVGQRRVARPASIGLLRESSASIPLVDGVEVRCQRPHLLGTAQASYPGALYAGRLLSRAER